MRDYVFIGNTGSVVTPSDTATFGPSLIYVGVTGSVNVTDTHGNQFAINGVAGFVLPIFCTQVRTGGTATNLIRITS